MLRLEWTQASGAVAAIEADVLVREGHEHAAEVTEHAVERGAAIADHVRPNNPTITLEGEISNTPIRVPTTQMDGVSGSIRPLELKSGGSVNVLQFDGPFDRVRTVDALCQELISTGTLVRIQTHLRQYEDMALTRFKVDLDAASGNALPFVLEAKRVRLVDTLTVQVPDPVERRGQRNRQRGNQPATQSAPQLRSLAARALDAITGH
jgi:hypothetical protein